MKTFPHFNKSSKCPICGTNKDMPCVLVPISGTEEGYNVACEQIHLDCIEPVIVKKDNEWILFQFINPK